VKALPARLATAAAGALATLGLVWVTASCLPSLDDLNDLFLKTAYRQYERAASDAVARLAEEQR
jgi:hypothetical protein